LQPVTPQQHRSALKKDSAIEILSSIATDIA